MKGASMQTPYDTGKIKIGSCYQPPVNVPMSADMERLQSALLDHRGPRVDIDVNQILHVACWAASACIGAILLLIYIPPQ
jgi:hypothetical protein